MDGSNLPASGATLAEDPTYAAQRDAVVGSGALPRFDDQIRYVLNAISVHPLMFPRIPGTSLRQVKTREWTEAPPLVILFTVDSATVRTLRWIELDADYEAG